MHEYDRSSPLHNFLKRWIPSHADDRGQVQVLPSTCKNSNQVPGGRDPGRRAKRRRVEERNRGSAKG